MNHHALFAKLSLQNVEWKLRHLAHVLVAEEAKALGILLEITEPDALLPRVNEIAAKMAAKPPLPLSGKLFISVKDSDKKHIVSAAKRLYDQGFELVATRGTATYLQEKGIPVQVVNKVLEGRPHIVDAIKNHEICMVINTTHGAQAVADSFSIRRNTLINNVAYYTTASGARAAVDGIIATSQSKLEVKSIQEYLK